MKKSAARGSMKKQAGAATTELEQPASSFLNVDLDLRSRADLTPLVDRLEPKTVVLRAEKYRGIYVASFELLSFRASTPDGCIAGLAGLIEDLPPAARRLWNGASERVFDVGIQAGADRQAFKPKIKAATLERVAALRADIVVTIYPYGWGEDGPAKKPGRGRDTGGTAR